MANMTWDYDEMSGRYLVKGARLRFPNFDGAEQDYNMKGKRNFRLVLDEALAREIKDRGVYVKERMVPGEDEETEYTVKIGVYADADIRLLSGRTMQKMTILGAKDRDEHPRDDDGAVIDREFQKGHVVNGDIDLEFHVSKNTKVAASSPYVRLDTAIIPIRKSRLLSEYEDYEDDAPFDE